MRPWVSVGSDVRRLGLLNLPGGTTKGKVVGVVGGGDEGKEEEEEWEEERGLKDLQYGEERERKRRGIVIERKFTEGENESRSIGILPN